ncbi:MAG: hypothetical protein AC479_01625 [miscellaneous Crenarchaeota group-6 archaeon AD8-1]|nr:MAG: hypothetical protein AC479_01625 [miscellaneous Crenarchaeota group-6 archaeon AD8-1]
MHREESLLLESKVISKLRHRLFREFLDIILLNELNIRNLGGYDALSFVYNKYGYRVSAGTIYSILYSLERRGLIRNLTTAQKTVFELTNEGEEMMDVILNNNDQIFVLTKKLIKLQ